MEISITTAKQDEMKPKPRDESNLPFGDIFTEKDHEDTDQCHVYRDVDIHHPETDTGITGVQNF